MGEASVGGWTERFNSSVRGIVTLGLMLGFIYGFVTDKIDGALYANTFAGIVAFWFASRAVASAISAATTTKTDIADGTTTTTVTAPSAPKVTS